MRTNGFEKPWNGMQITTWLLLPILLIHFLMCLTPTLPKALSAPLTIAYIISAFAAMRYGYITTKTDAIDHLLYKHKYGAAHPSATSQSSSSNVEEADTKYCWVCQTNVYNQSMHCKYCDKCVGVFDHHCMWLNTCIGTENYRDFFRTVVWTFVFVSIHVGTIATQLGLYFVDNRTIRRLASEWFNADVDIVLVGINIGMLVFTASTAFMVLQLLVFHIGLQREGVTTYQYIIRDTAEKRDKSIFVNKVRQRRIEELEKSGSAGEAFVLKMGALACCTSCDPVRRLVLQEMEHQDTLNSMEGRHSSAGNVKIERSYSDASSKDELKDNPGEKHLNTL